MESLARDTFSILEPIVALMPRVVTIDSVEDDGDDLYTLNTCNTLWLTIGYVFTYNSVDYTVRDLVTNEWVQVEGGSLPEAGDFTIDAPHFDHGTFLMKNAELKKDVANVWDYLPMIYLHEPTDNQNFPDDDDNAIGRIATCDFYFMIDCKYSEWLTLDHYRYAVRPMRNLMNEFINTLKAHGGIGIIESVTDFDCPNWGITVDTKGSVRRLIDDELSGVGCRVDIPLTKSLVCPEC